MSPIILTYTTIVYIGRIVFQHRSFQKRLQQLADEDDKDVENNDKSKKIECKGTLPLIDMYSEWANGVGRISQDVPLNRFINFIFYYALFLSLLVFNIINPFLNDLPKGHEYHRSQIASQLVLFVYLLPALPGEVYRHYWGLYIGRKRMFPKSFFFWMLMILRDILLTTSVICNVILYSVKDTYTCRETNISNLSTTTWSFQNETKFGSDTSEKSSELEEVLRKMSVVTFAIGNL